MNSLLLSYVHENIENYAENITEYMCSIHANHLVLAFENILLVLQLQFDCIFIKIFSVILMAFNEIAKHVKR